MVFETINGDSANLNWKWQKPLLPTQRKITSPHGNLAEPYAMFGHQLRNFHRVLASLVFAGHCKGQRVFVNRSAMLQKQIQYAHVLDGRNRAHAYIYICRYVCTCVYTKYDISWRWRDPEANGAEILVTKQVLSAAGAHKQGPYVP